LLSRRGFPPFPCSSGILNIQVETDEKKGKKLMNLYREHFDVEKILRLRASQYVQPLYVEDIVEAGLTKSTPLPLSTIGAFLVLSFTGFFTCLRIKAAPALEDLGICPLRMKIQAGASGLEMFGNYVPMNILLSPGRVRVNPLDPALITGGATLANADQGPIPNQLFYPTTYQYPFQANDTISISVKNDFDASVGGWKNRWGICFFGIRCRDIKKAFDETKQPKVYTPTAKKV
jgi:hypothetical protein